MVCDLVDIVSNELQSSNTAMLSNIGEEFKCMHVGLSWPDIGFATLSCALETHLPNCYSLSSCRNFVQKEADLAKLDIGNGISSIVEPTPFKQPSGN